MLFLIRHIFNRLSVPLEGKCGSKFDFGLRIRHYAWVSIDVLLFRIRAVL